MAAPSHSESITYLGDGEMVTTGHRVCSLCGAFIIPFRTAHPILRYDPAAPYYQRVGVHRGWTLERRIGWSCGRHRAISADWEPVENFSWRPLDNRSATVHSSDTMEAKDEIRQIREKMGLSREAFAHKIGRTSSTIFKWEHGRVPVDETALRYARTFVTSNGERETYA